MIILLLLGLLAGCDGTTEAQASGGTLYLNTDSVIEIVYDEEGIVVSITAGSENAKEIVEAYTDFSDKTCSQVVEELIAQMGEQGYFEEENTSEITFDETKGLPEEDFVRDIETQVQEIVKENGWDTTITVETPVSDTTTQENEPESEKKSIPEGAIKQSDGTYLPEELQDANGEVVDDEKDAILRIIYVYDADGILIYEEGKRIPTGKTCYYLEYYENCYRKIYKNWNEDGILVREFTSFHSGDEQNGITTEYDSNGEPSYRTTEGNPDGSNATMEQWTVENGGEHIMSIYDAPYIILVGEDGNPMGEAQVQEVRYTLGNGDYHYHIYDYENETMHTIGYWANSNSKRDMITNLYSDEPIEGYEESTIDGMHRRVEWKDQKKVLEIQDGAYYMGYKVKDTSHYYSNGQVKSFERYFYADGGHYYVEYDEAGNETFFEITTAYY